MHVDFGKVMQRMRELRAKLSANDSAKRFASLGVDVYQVLLLACCMCSASLHQSSISLARFAVMMDATKVLRDSA